MEYMDTSTGSFKMLYTGLVRPHFTLTKIWSPHHMKHINALDNVQRRATKQIPGLSHLSYPKRLELIGLPTLAYRRVRGDMIEMYKILCKQV